MNTTTTATTHTLNLVDIGPVEVTVDERGEGRPFLVLHGGGGPDTMRTFAELLANTHPARVIAPIHPGFGGTACPKELHTIRELAALYVALLDLLELSDVTVSGNSIGGWIAAELGLLEAPRVSGVILRGVSSRTCGEATPVGKDRKTWESLPVEAVWSLRC